MLSFSQFNSEQKGQISILASLLNVVIVILALTQIVVKAKKVLDFALTAYIFHFLICMIYSGLRNLQWRWVWVNLILVALTITLGEFICLKLEQKQILIQPKLFFGKEKNDSLQEVELENQRGSAPRKSVPPEVLVL